MTRASQEELEEKLSRLWPPLSRSNYSLFKRDEEALMKYLIDRHAQACLSIRNKLLKIILVHLVHPERRKLNYLDSGVGCPVILEELEPALASPGNNAVLVGSICVVCWCYSSIQYRCAVVVQGCIYGSVSHAWWYPAIAKESGHRWRSCQSSLCRVCQRRSLVR